MQTTPYTILQLWEMACARNIGLSSIPIVCVNIDGFYDSFRIMLERAWDDNLTKLRPEQIIHLADTAEEAVRWIEEVQGVKPEHQVSKKKEKEVLRYSSVIGTPQSGSCQSNGLWNTMNVTHWVGVSCFFVVGFVTGTIFAKKK